MTSDRPMSTEGVVGRCPICKAPTDWAARPFCSRRCADIDLSRWLSGVYSVPANSSDADEDGESSTIAGVNAAAAEGTPRDTE